MLTSRSNQTVPRRGDRMPDGGLRVWPLRKPALAVLAKGGALLLAVWSAAGLLFMQFLDGGPVGDADRAVAEWFEDGRTARINSLSHYGSLFSDTLVKVVLVAVVGAVLVLLVRRWHDAVFLAMTVIFEASIFVVSSLIVGRERPPVEQLDQAAPSGSFPSGHSAAAVAFYAGVFVLVGWHTRRRAVRIPLGIIAIVVPIVVATSRVSRGMHHPLDVVAGMLLGVASILVVRAALQAGTDAIDQEADSRSLPERVRRLDLTRPARSAAHVPQAGATR